MKRLVALAALLVAPVLLAKPTRELEMRAYLHDPVRPTAALQFKGKSGTLTALDLRTEGLSPECQTTLEEEELVIHLGDGAVAARAKVPAEVKRAAVILIPAAKDSTPPYRMIVMDDSPAVFHWGESRVISLLGVETAVQAGEHKLPLPAGKITAVPEVKKVDEFNMAQTNFYFREGTAWVPFTERRMQFTNEVRRIFVVHVTPGSQQPFVATLVDYKPHEGT
jgi:hypothetical protein